MIRLVTLDLDGTLLPQDTTFGAILRRNGQARLVEETDGAYFAGKLSLEACFWQQWDWVRQLSLQQCHRALREAAWLPGIGDGVARLHEAGFRVCLLTDQPSSLAEFLGRWGLTDPICSPATVKDGMATAIDARFDKLANLRLRLAEWNIQEREVCHVGNGANDIPVFQKVGMSVAVGGDPLVEAAATHVVKEPVSLTEVADRVVRHAGKMESSSKSPQTR